ncbi:MAG: hypothetical protein FWC78_07050 [Defluviitaleaceae bacterium]|nr:hypothetical protein [Defluviitaleaceae bacterium]
MEIIYKNLLAVDEYNAIRKAMGWRRLHPEQAQGNIEGNAFVVSAYDGPDAIAMAGLRWNGGSFASLNILLHPEYEDCGIQEEFTARVFDFLRGKLKPGFGIQVDICVRAGQEGLYENLGFEYITPENRGVPMHICLTNQVELTDKMFGQMGF